MPDDTYGSSRPSNGHDTNGALRPVFGRRLPDGDDAAPIDLVAVQADDALITAVGARAAVPAARSASDEPARDGAGDLPRGGADLSTGARGGLDGDDLHDADDRLVAMLAAWRAEIDAEPIPELVDLDAAVAAVTAGMAQHTSAVRRRRAGRLRQLAPLAAAAAIIVATVTGVGVGSQNAVPGDTLWAIQKVVNPQRAESVEAKVKVESRLETVRDALQKGDTDTAAKELDAIRTEIPAVRGQEGKPQLVQEQAFLAAKLADTPPGHPADLSTPPKSDPGARSTGTAAAPAAPPVDSSASPSAATSPSGPKSTEPDTRRSADRSKDAVVPVPPVRTPPVAPAPERSAPDVTSAPEAPLPKPKPDPTKPGRSEGKPDPSSAPGPVDQSPPSGADSGPPADSGSGGGDASGRDAGGGTSSDTTAAAGSAGADVHTTATDPTT